MTSAIFDLPGISHFSMTSPFKNNKPDLKNFTLEELTAFVREMGLKPFRARQIFSWLYRPGITSFPQMTDISLELRDLLEQKAQISIFIPSTVEKSKDGTVKFAFRLSDGALIESVLIPEQDRNTLCVSSQVGCGMGCTFCLTGTMGFKRNLNPSEMVNQVCAAIEYLTAKKMGSLNNLVFMGMGEPLANLSNLLSALDILMDQRGLDFSSRRITVSTCGLIPQIEKLGRHSTVNLAISLHAVDDKTRDLLMPVNKKYPLNDLFEACRMFPLPKRRRIMIEYVLLKDVNDTPSEAAILAKRLRNIRCKINLIPFNETPPLPFLKPSPERVETFREILHKAGYTVIIRHSRGEDISAACGQLACKN